MAACGAYVTTAVSQDGDLWTMGKGDDGALGANTSESHLQPLCMGHVDFFGGLRVVMSSAGSCKSGAVGQFHAAALTEDGSVWVWGCGIDGRLGHGEEEEIRPRPVQLGKDLFGGDALIIVSCGGTFTMALSCRGAVWTWGSGTLGHGDRQRSFTPICIDYSRFKGSRVAMIAAGVQHALAATIEGSVFSWGRNKGGRLGLGDEEDRLVPAAIERDKFRSGEMQSRQIAMLAAGFNHSMAVSVNGALFSWGDGCSGKLGLGDRNQRLEPALVGAEEVFGAPVVMATCGGTHSMATTEEGALFAWGYGGGGRLGAKDASNKLVPTRIRTNLLGNSRVVVASAGSSHSCALTEDGGLYTWGPGEIYAGAFKNVCFPTGLGHGDTQDKHVPTRVPVDGVQFGRCRRLPAAHALALAMATHKRLGQGCAAFLRSEMTGDVLKRIVAAAGAWPHGHAGQHAAAVLLVGGGLMASSRRLVTVVTVVDEAAAFRPPVKLKDEMEGDSDGGRDGELMESETLHGKKDRGCRCGRTKCLKQYCQCFRNDVRCLAECVCTDCHNDGLHEEKRIEAIRRIRMTNFRAFKGTELEIEDVSVVTPSGSVKLIRGCRCKRSRCKKKYCECYAASLECTTNCVCKDCDNGNDSAVIKSVAQIMKSSKATGSPTSAASTPAYGQDSSGMLHKLPRLTTSNRNTTSSRGKAPAAVVSRHGGEEGAHGGGAGAPWHSDEEQALDAASLLSTMKAATGDGRARGGAKLGKKVTAGSACDLDHSAGARRVGIKGGAVGIKREDGAMAKSDLTDARPGDNDDEAKQGGVAQGVDQGAIEFLLMAAAALQASAPSD